MLDDDSFFANGANSKSGRKSPLQMNSDETTTSDPDRTGVPAIGFAILALVVLYMSAHHWSIAELTALDDWPGEMQDEVFFDQLAYTLQAQDKLAMDFGDLPWLQSYIDRNKIGQYDWVYELQGSGVTTSRAPGFPYVLAWCYDFFGREFTHIRRLNLIALALGLTFLAMTVRKYAGWFAGIIAVALLCMDMFVMRTGGQIMPEAISTALTAVTFAMLIRAWNHPRELERPGWRWFVIGVLFGAMTLFGFQPVFWLLQLVVLGAIAILFSLLRRPRGKTDKDIADPGILSRAVGKRIGTIAILQSAGLFLFGVILVAAPWWVRNIRESGQFAPLGSEVGIGMVGGYCDDAFENQGNISLTAVQQNHDDVMSGSEGDLSEMERPRIELIIARSSTNRALAWSGDHAARLPQLMLMKAGSHLVPDATGLPGWLSIANLALLAFALIGCVVAWRKIGAWLGLMILLSLVTTMLTWSDHGRLSIPIRPLIDVAAAVGLSGALASCRRLIRGSEN